MAKDHGPHVKDDHTYEALRDEGASKEKAARIANASARPDRRPSARGGEAGSYDDWTRDALYDRAKELDVEGRSRMSREDLIAALRDR